MPDTLIILAGGKSSRMKNSSVDDALSAELDAADIDQANQRSKALLPVGPDRRPLLDFVLQNSREAGYHDVILVVPEDNADFRAIYGSEDAGNRYQGLKIAYAIQYIPEGRSKPFGTADAVFQALEQYPHLRQQAFGVCNSDNLYSIEAMRRLRLSDSPNSWISYDRAGLEFPAERIARFAVCRVDEHHRLLEVVEKPPLETIDDYRDKDGIVRVSMNIFKFSGNLFYPYLKKCPVTPGREEKELASAIRLMLADHPGCMTGIPMSEHVPDLTAKSDIINMRRYLEGESEKRHGARGMGRGTRKNG